jgi:glycosyltransferase involved in cell wall biosynthesis
MCPRASRHSIVQDGPILRPRVSRSPRGRGVPARIVHLTILHPPLDGRIFRKEARTLAAAGYDVHFVAPGAKGVQDGVVLHGLGVPRELGPRYTFARLRAAYAAARSLRGDVYHFHDPELIPVALLLKMRGARVVYDAHEDTPRQVREFHPGRPLLGRAIALCYAVAERTCGAVVDAVVAATPSIAKRYPHHKTVVVHNFPIAAEAAGFVGGPHSERPANVVYVGNMTAIRGVAEMAAAIERVREPSARLVLGGTGTVAAEGERIDALGWLPRDGVAAVLREARAGLVVFHPLPPHVEALPTKLFEYMAAGIPVVASDFPLWRELVGEAGILVDPFDVDAIAAAIDRLLADPDEAERMGDRGREAVVTRFSWESEAEQLLSLYERLGVQAPSRGRSGRVRGALRRPLRRWRLPRRRRRPAPPP